MKQLKLIKPQWLKDLKKEITKGFGKPCKDFYFNCMVCQVWMAYQILEEYFTEEE